MSAGTTRRVSSLIAVIVVAVLAPVAPVRAHPDLDEGRARYERADFPGALEAFASAVAADDLTRDELLDLLERRILVHLVLGDQASADRDLTSLHAIDPEHELAADIPPEVVQAFDALGGGALALTLSTDPGADVVAVTARVEGDPTGLVREVRVHHRLDDGPWEVSSGTEVEVAAREGSTMALYAEAVGPGGAVIANSGSVDSPREVRVGALAGAGAEPVDGDAGGGVPWLWVGVGGASVVVVALVVALLASGGGESTDTHPYYPMIEF